MCRRSNWPNMWYKNRCQVCVGRTNKPISMRIRLHSFNLRHSTHYTRNRQRRADIPSFTQSFTRRAAQHEFYDRPSNNMSIVSGLNTLGYSYTTTTAKHNGGAQLDVVVLPKQQQQKLSSTTPTTTSAANVVDGAIAATTTLSRSKSLEAASRKSSFEHIYDEIKYADRVPSVVMLK